MEKADTVFIVFFMVSRGFLNCFKFLPLWPQAREMICTVLVCEQKARCVDLAYGPPFEKAYQLLCIEW